MPNWVDNHLQLIGELPAVAVVLADLVVVDTGDGKWIDFQRIHPCPKELLDTEAERPQTAEQIANLAKYGYADWHEWRTKNWGTISGGYDPSFDYSPGSRYADVWFGTAWTSPYELKKFLSVKHPDVYFTVACSDWMAEWRGYYWLLNGVEIQGRCEKTDEYYDGLPYDTLWYDHEIDDGRPIPENRWPP